jgi:hypothetical protein
MERRRRADLAHITCPQCGRTTWNRNDVINRYCGWCHMFHADMKKEKRNWLQTILEILGIR